MIALNFANKPSIKAIITPSYSNKTIKRTLHKIIITHITFIFTERSFFKQFKHMMHTTTVQTPRVSHPRPVILDEDMYLDEDEGEYIRMHPSLRRVRRARVAAALQPSHRPIVQRRLRPTRIPTCWRSLGTISERRTSYLFFRTCHRKMVLTSYLFFCHLVFPLHDLKEKAQKYFYACWNFSSTKNIFWVSKSFEKLFWTSFRVNFWTCTKVSNHMTVTRESGQRGAPEVPP